MLKIVAITGVAFLVVLATNTHVRAAAATMTVTQTTNDTTNDSSYSYSFTYNNTEPTDSQIANWDSGWGSSRVTGWNYVGSDNGASAVYLGDGYVLTAGHVGAGNFSIDGQTYDYIAGTAQGFGTSDLTLYKIDTTSTTGTVLNLPALTLATTAPAVNTSVVMIGYGNSQGETWATNTVYESNQTTKITSPTYTSTDFYTQDHFHQTGSSTTGNTTTTTYLTSNGQLVPGDSGGGDFIYDSATQTWELAGINEVQLENNSGVVVGSGMVQISTYAAQLQAVVPEPSTWCLLGAGLVTLAATVRTRKRVLAPARL